MVTASQIVVADVLRLPTPIGGPAGLYAVGLKSRQLLARLA